MIFSYLAYGILAWGHSTMFHQLFKLQCRAIHGSSHYKNDNRVFYRQLKSLQYPSCTRIFWSHFCTSDEILIIIPVIMTSLCTKHNTRHNSKLYPRYLRLKRSQTAIDYYGIKFFNQIPRHVQILPLIEFKTTVKRYFVTKVYLCYVLAVVMKLCKFISD